MYQWFALDPNWKHEWIELKLKQKYRFIERERHNWSLLVADGRKKLLRIGAKVGSAWDIIRTHSIFVRKKDYV